MESLFRPYQPDQQYLLPPSLRDWLPADHLAYFISDTVDALDLSGIKDAYRRKGSGNVAYHPALMLKLLIYGYATGVFSSRKIAQGCETDVAFRLLGAGDPPGHRTLARFRKAHLLAFGDLFVQVVGIAQGAGLVTLGTLAIDGSKLRANASKHKAMTYERMKKEDKRLKREIDALIARAEGVDEEEDVEFGPDFRGDELPKELANRERRRRVIRAAMKRLEARKKEQDAEALERERRAEAQREASGAKKPAANASTRWASPSHGTKRTSRIPTAGSWTRRRTGFSSATTAKSLWMPTPRSSWPPMSARIRRMSPPSFR